LLVNGTGVSSSTGTATGTAAVAAGIPRVGNTTTYTTGNECSWGLILAGTPLPTQGRVSVTGLVGNYTAHIITRSDFGTGPEVTQNTETHSPGPDGNATPGPLWEWTTNEPDTLEGHALKITVNGRIVYTTGIALDPDGNFNYELQFDPNNPEYLLPVHTPDGTPLPQPSDDVTNSDIPDPEAPPENPGPSPIGDTTPHESMTVEDHYRATRQAMEDSLKSGVTPNFNVNDWLGDEAPSDPDAESAAGIVGDALDVAGAGAGGIGPLEVPGLTGAAPLTFTIWGITRTIHPVPGASIIRALLLFFLLVAAFILNFRLIRGAFTASH